MNTLDRRRLLTTAVGAGAALAAGRWLEPTASAADPPNQRIKIGQIGAGHEHASAKTATIRKLSDHYEVVGIVESDPDLRKRHENSSQIIRGERKNPYPLQHELLVQKCLLEACGYPTS